MLAAEVINFSESVTVELDEENLTVFNSSAVLFSRPIGELESLQLNGDQGDNEVTLDFRSGDIIPDGGLRVDGSDGLDTLWVVGTAQLDLRGQQLDVINVESLDLTDSQPQVITLDAGAVRSISPTLTVRAGTEDELVFADASQWRMSASKSMSGDFRQSIVHQSTGEVIQADVDTSFKNLIVASDVNNDGIVSARDVLNVINEMAVRRISSATDGRVVDPATLASFPGFYPDHNGDNVVSALDALRVINQLAALRGVVPINVAVTKDEGVQQNPSIAVNPNDPQHVVIAYMDYSLVDTGYAGIGVSVSRDGGMTWQKSNVPVPSPFDQGAAIPVTKFDAQGRVYVSYMAATFHGQKPGLTNIDIFNPTTGGSDRVFGFESDNGIFVSRSDDGGLTWEQSSTVVSHIYDAQTPVNFEILPDLAIDTFEKLPDGQANPNFGNLYVTWSRVYVPGEFPGHSDIDGSIDIMIALSRDNGQTWETQLEELIDDEGNPYESTTIRDELNTVGLPGLSVVDQARIAIGSAGEVYVANGGCGDFTVHMSTDAGATFEEPDHGTGHRIAFGTGCATTTGLDPLPTNHFRKNFVRSITVDPSHPGRVFAVDTIDVFDPKGNLLGPDVIFARSDDQGETWQEYTIDDEPAVLNDDNDNRIATGLPSDVIAGQVLARSSTDGQGNIGVIWYDTRRDPLDHLIDVFGTISIDGGQTFSPNFRVASISFDADQGRFTNGQGADEFYLGDFIGLAMTNNTAYASWTDTRNGNQDIFFARFDVDSPPRALNDRFEPNDTFGLVADVTRVGRVVQRFLPKLELPPEDEDWFSFEAVATGELIVAAEFEFNDPKIRDASDLPNPESLTLELYDHSGQQLLATGLEVTGTARQLGDDGNFSDVVRVTGKEIRLPTFAGDRFQTRVVGTGREHVSYALKLQSLTSDLGTRAYVREAGSVSRGDGSLYLINAAAAGSLQVDLTAGANLDGLLQFQILDAESLEVLQEGRQGVTIHAAAAEPNDSIGQAVSTGLVMPGSVAIDDGEIGDGDFADSSGDIDFFSLSAEANQRITVVVDVASAGSDLDSLVALYDSDGQLLEVVDGAGSGTNELLTFDTDKAGMYYVAVMGWQSFPPADPQTPGTGAGAGDPGAYQLRIRSEQLDAGAVLTAFHPVRKSESFLIQVTGIGQSAGDFVLEVTNLDQLSAPQRSVFSMPAGEVPSQADVGDFNADGKLDVAVTDVLSDTTGILLGNGDGTFQALRPFVVGAFVEPPPGDLTRLLPTFGRDVTTADFNQDDVPDLAVTNRASSDVSLLLGHGDGTFQPQRRFDGPPSPIALESADLNNDGDIDLAIISSGTTRRTFVISTLLGQGDGNFDKQVTTEVPNGGELFNLGAVQVGEFNGDGVPDLVVSGSGNPEVAILLGAGDGSFSLLGFLTAARLSVGLVVADINGDGHQDILNTGFDHRNQVAVLLGNGDATFQPSQEFFAGQNPVALEVADVGSRLQRSDGRFQLGPPDGRLDVVVAASGTTVGSVRAETPPGIFVLPGISDAQDPFALGELIQVADATRPQDIDIGDFDNDGLLDVVSVSAEGLVIAFGKAPEIVNNGTPSNARDLGTVTHYLDQTQTIVPGREHAYYRFAVPTESVTDADQVVDVSLLFEQLEGSGIGAELRDASGTLLASGERFRVRARQGEELTLHVFGVEESGQVGYGAFTPIINVLPQVVSIEAQALLPGTGDGPGGPTASIVLTLQGDRLDRDSAEATANYTVTAFGGDRLLGTADDVQIPVADAVYSPSTNIDVSTGRTFPTAVQQTVTLEFAGALPAGSYQIEIDGLVTEVFNEQEADLLADTENFGNHPLISLEGGRLSEQISVADIDLVMATGSLGDVSAAFKSGTPFLTQLHDDLASVLDATLTELGDAAEVTDVLLERLLSRLLPSIGPRGERSTSLMALIIDPASIDIEDSEGEIFDYDIGAPAPVTTDDDCYAEVSGNIEVVICNILDPVVEYYEMAITDQPETVRGGVVLIGADDEIVMNLTDDLRNGIEDYLIGFPSGME